MTTDHHDHLTTYFAGRRWFAGKGRGFTVVHVHSLPWLSDSEPRVRIEIVTVQYDDGTRDAYQFPIAYLHESEPEMSHAHVGTFDHPDLGWVVAYDAVYLKSAVELLLQGFRQRRESDDLAFRMVEGAELPDESSAGSVMTAEQSNTSVAYGDEAILKLFRRVSSGGNPDIEILEALSTHGAKHVAPLLGWIDASWTGVDDEPAQGHLGLLQVFLRTATDGWDMALTSVRDLLVEEDLHPDEVGGDFAAESERLGRATAEIHHQLAVLFPTGTLDDDQRAAIVETMRIRLETAIRSAEELRPYAEGLLRRYDAVLHVTEPIAVQRVHGDFHLGQTLRTVKNWKIIDFEGEPAKPLTERVGLDSPMRDLAGMLRSFDYAAGATLREFGTAAQLRYRADEWAGRNRSAFLAGYVAETVELSPGQHTLLRAYEADKAVYETVYEVRNRPTWLGIPLYAVARLAAEEA